MLPLDADLMNPEMRLARSPAGGRLCCAHSRQRGQGEQAEAMCLPACCSTASFCTHPAALQSGVDLSNVKFSLNPFCEIAIEVSISILISHSGL